MPEIDTLSGSAIHSPNASETPPYRRIEQDLRIRIATGTLPAGSRLPGRAALAREYGVALKTVEKAVGRLLADGTLRADSRRGTFVAGDADAIAYDGAHEDAALEPAPDTNRAAHLPALFHPASPVIRIKTLGILMHGGVEHDFGKRTITDSLERAFAPEPGIARYRDIARPPATFAGGAADLLNDGIDALAVIAIRGDISEREIEAVQAAVGGRVPVAYITTGPIPQPVPQVFFDQSAAGFQAARHLLGGGAKRLLFLAPFAAGWVAQRIEGARQAAAAAGLPPDAVRLLPETPDSNHSGEDNVEQARVMARELLDAAPLPECVIGANDAVARGFMQAAAERGYVAGRDYRIIGFDDEPEAREAGLSTVRPPLEALGEETARLLRRMIAGETAAFQIRLSSEVVPRFSSLAPSGGSTRRA